MITLAGQTLRCARVFALILVLVVASRYADAGIVFEHYQTDRPAEIEAAASQLLEELSDRSLVAQPVAVRAELGTAAPSPGLRDRSLTAQDLLAAINAGLKAQYDLRYDSAIVQLVAAIDNGRANPTLLVSAPAYREAMLDALIGLASSYHRRNRADDRQRGIEVMQEVVRSFPDRLAGIRQTYGPEPDAILRTAQRQLDTLGTGSLVVDVDDPSVQIFVDEGAQPSNATFRAKLPPGTYRILIKHPTTSGRRYELEVRANETAKLSIKWGLAASLVSTSRWVGFAGISDVQALAFARQLALPKHAALVLITMVTWKGSPAIKATLHKSENGAVVRSLLVPLDSWNRAVAGDLATRILKGGEVKSPIVSSGLHVEPIDNTSSDVPEKPSRSTAGRRWYIAAGLAAGVALVNGAVAIRYQRLGVAAGNELDRVCAVTCTSDQVRSITADQDAYNRRAVTFGALGGVAAAGAIVLLIVGKTRSPA